MTASIKYFGHSTVLITTEEGKKVVIDPWFGDNPACPAPEKDPGHVDYIALTHAHYDHCGSAIEVATKYQAKVIAIYDLIGALSGEGLPGELGEGMNKGGTITVGNLKFSLTHALHSSSYQAKDGSLRYGGEACGVVVTLESGKTVYHCGDTCLFSDMKLIGEEFNPTVALIPIGDRFTMNPQAAAKAVTLIKPHIVIPIHHGTFSALTGTPDQFADALKHSDCDLRILKPGETTTF